MTSCTSNTSYSDLVTSFVARLKVSPYLTATLYNTLKPMMLQGRPLELRNWYCTVSPLSPDSTEDLRDTMDTLTLAKMRSILLEMGWEEDEMMKETLRCVAIDDSYRMSAFVDLSDPDVPRIVRPCDVPLFGSLVNIGELCENEEYMVDGVLTWKALQDFAPAWASMHLVAITMDLDTMSFPLPS